MLRHQSKWEAPSFRQLAQLSDYTVVVETNTTLHAKRGSGAVGRDKIKAKIQNNSNMGVNRKNTTMIANELKMARESIATPTTASSGHRSCNFDADGR